ncbi:MAG: carboxypeptidase-like regulatory domain-containing protein, partial [Armatimonadota bacterium]|nr:carboxypeptidase-like regulatory domain-containing protein [Armatimonadota bacterium]
MLFMKNIFVRAGRFSGLAVLFLCALYWVAGANAQVETTSALRGIVTDPAHAVMPGASVLIKDVNTGETRTAETDTRGAYSFPSLSPGTYTVTVTKSGFKTAVITGRALEVGQPGEVDVVLQLDSTAQSVTVSAAGAELLNTTTGEISSLVSSRLVQNAPLNGRDFFDLAVLTPGAVSENLTSTLLTFASISLNFVQGAGTFVGAGIILSGNRDSAANVSIDGSNVQSPVYQQAVQIQSPDDIQDMKIESGNMNAEFGNGVTAINIVTKSGSNQFHGTAYEYNRSDKYDAIAYFTNLAGQKNPPYHVNQFGGAVGGPIKRNKLLFFANYEGFRLNQEAFEQAAVPDNNLRAGDFSQYHLITGTTGNLVSQPTPTIYNPYSYDPVTGLRNPFPGNKIPLGPTTLCAPRPTCVDPSTLAFLQKWIAPPNGVLNGTPVLQG